MARNSYQDQLEELRGEVTAMGELSLSRYEMAVEVLGSGDPVQAEAVIDGDTELNEWYLDLENDCIELIALQQPVASDLRFIASSFKIITDLERIGDLATNLAAYGRDADGSLQNHTEIAAVAGEMAADALAAYEEASASAAREIAARDESFDEQCKQASKGVVRDLVTGERTLSGESDEEMEDISRSLLTIRDLERVGDHAVNICARTLYMIENDDELIY